MKERGSQDGEGRTARARSAAFRATAALLVPAILAAALFGVWRVRPPEIKTSLYDLVGAAADAIPPAVRERSANLVPVVVSSADFDAAIRVADALAATLPTNDCASVHFKADGAAVAEILDFCATNRSGLASASVRPMLATPEGRAKVARLAARRAYSSLLPPLFPPDADPFGLADGFASSVPASLSGWSAQRGFLTAEKDGETHVLLLMDLKPSVASDTDALIAFRARFAAARDAALASEPSVRAVACGVPMHTAEAAAKCKSEIGWLTAFSVLFIAALSAVAFKSLKWTLHLALSLGVAALAGGLALALLFPSVHLMTFVFGTTLLGLVVDYAFHWLLQPPDSSRRVARGLAVSFATTLAGLLPLALSSIPVLRQSAVFLAIGLAASLATVLLLFPRPGIRRVEDNASCRPCQMTNGKWQMTNCLFSLLLLLPLLLFGICRARFGTDLAALYVPSSELLGAERVIAELSGGADGERGVIVTEGGDDLEALLEKENSLAVSGASLSRLMPPLSVRRAVASDAAKLYAERGAEQARLLGLAAPPEPPPAPRPWTWDDIPTAAARAFVHGHALVVPSARAPAGPLPDGVAFCRPKAILEGALADWTRETRRRLAAALALMGAVVLAVYRRRALAVAAPSAIALAAVCAFLGFTGEAVNLFHTLAAFLLAGMCVDYAVFLRGGGRAAFKGAFCALLTSIAGFGALAFVSFPVVRAFGITLGIGLPVGFLAALAARKPTGNDGAALPRNDE